MTTSEARMRLVMHKAGSIKAEANRIIEANGNPEAPLTAEQVDWVMAHIAGLADDIASIADAELNPKAR